MRLAPTLTLFPYTTLFRSFTIDELVIASDDIAYALTRSNGTQTVLATNAQSAEANREMFVFRNEDGAWKIARYMFKDRKSTRLNSSHTVTSYAVFCLKKKK